MFKCFAALALCALMIGCATTVEDDYLVDGRTVRGPRQDARALTDATNAHIAALTPDPRHPHRLLHAVAPVMPREAIERGIEGDVHVVLLVDAAGRIAEVKVLQSPHVMLSEATVKAMQQWVFSPLIVDGSPRAFKVRQTYAFRIGD